MASLINTNHSDHSDDSDNSDDFNEYKNDKNDKYNISIEDFKKKFMSKMREFAEKYKTDQIKYYRLDVEGGSEFSELDIHNTLFQSHNSYELWIKLVDLKIIYDDEDDLDLEEFNEILNEYYDDNVLIHSWPNKFKPLHEMTENEIIEWFVIFEIKSFTYDDYVCNDEIWWIEMKNIF